MIAAFFFFKKERTKEGGRRGANRDRDADRGWERVEKNMFLSQIRELWLNVILDPQFFPKKNNEMPQHLLLPPRAHTQLRWLPQSCGPPFPGHVEPTLAPRMMPPDVPPSSRGQEKWGNAPCCLQGIWKFLGEANPLHSSLFPTD